MTLSAPFSAVFWLFSGCRAFGTSVDGRRDCNLRETQTDLTMYQLIRGCFMPCAAAIESCHSLSGPVRDIPHIAQYLFEVVSQSGVSHPFALFSCGIAQVSLRYPFCGGGGSIAPPFRMLSTGETLSKGYRTQLAMLRDHKPHSAQ